ncbi:MAG: HypC/HybG/HupF family hydrogenase formation chaperone [Actinobacteria bacterium]|nr:HypC/HybG/HupF family hydrogenase formation chaperone [Actinomycetota bacterium]
MCLAVPAQVLELMEDETALIEMGGVRKVVSLMLLDGVVSGDYVLVHAGFAIEKVDREEAERTLAVLEKAAEFGPLYE